MQGGRVQITVAGGLAGFVVTAVPRAFEPGKPQVINVPLAAGESALLSFVADSGVACTFQWQTVEQIKADDAALAEALKAVAAQRAAAAAPKPPPAAVPKP
jgi:hypothetical protein